MGLRSARRRWGQSGVVAVLRSDGASPTLSSVEEVSAARAAASASAAGAGSAAAAAAAAPRAAHASLGAWRATAIAGNDLLSSCLYSAGAAARYAGALAPLSLLAVSGMLYFFRFVYAEVVTALPVNGGSCVAPPPPPPSLPPPGSS
jgi:hypothetical protein